MEVSDWLHVPAALHSGTETRYSLKRNLGSNQSRFRIEPRFPTCPIRSLITHMTQFN